MIRVPTTALAAFAVFHLSAQIPTFKKRHGTSGDDEARFVEVLPDNSFIVAGSSTACTGNCRTITATFIGTPPFMLTVESPAGSATFSFQTNT